MIWCDLDLDPSKSDLLQLWLSISKSSVTPPPPQSPTHALTNATPHTHNTSALIIFEVAREGDVIAGLTAAAVAGQPGRGGIGPDC